jgi:hypothetical protein
LGIEGDNHMLVFVVARTRLDRYEELHRELEDWRDVRVILDRREGERRQPHDTFAGAEKRRAERRQPQPDLRKLGWSVFDPDELVSWTSAPPPRTRRLRPRPSPPRPLTADATPPAWNGYLLTVACPCGVVLERWVTPLGAELDLLRAAPLN